MTPALGLRHQGVLSVKRPVLVVILTLCAAAAVRGDQPLAREAFRSPQTSLFGADNLTFDRTDSPAPFDRLLRLSPHVPVASGEVFIGPNERGTLEDTVWLRLECLDETLPGAMGSLSVVAFEDDGPQLRITRRSLRREAALE